MFAGLMRVVCSLCCVGVWMCSITLRFSSTLLLRPCLWLFLVRTLFVVCSCELGFDSGWFIMRSLLV